MYEIQQLILTALNVSTKSSARKLLAEKLPHINLAKSFASADMFLAGKVKESHASMLSTALSIPIEQIKRAITLTLKQKKQEDRAQFYNALGQHIWIETSGPVKQPTFAALLFRKLCIIPLVHVCENHQGTEIQYRRVMELFDQYKNLSQGELPIFGRIIGYRWVLNANIALRFDLNHQLINLIFKPNIYGKVTIRKSNQTVNGFHS